MTQSDASARESGTVTPERAREITNEILVETGVPEDGLTSSSTLEDLGLDSSDVVQIELDVRRQTGLQIELRDLFPSLTVEGLVAKVVQAATQA